MVKICVIIDYREEDLWGLLEPWHDREGSAAKQDGWWAVKKPLDVGDICFMRVGDVDVETEVVAAQPEELVLLERKSAEDLGASQRDGRYREQRARLLAKKGAGVSVGYVLEAPMPWSSTLTRTWCRGSFKETHLQHAIAKLQMHYGLTVLQASTTKETLMWIRRIAGALVEDPTVYKSAMATEAASAAAAYTQAIHVKKAANMDSERLLTTVLRTLPGVGATAAEAIVHNVGTGGFPAFYELSQEDLAAIPLGSTKRKIGSALAGKVWAAFHTSGSS